VDDRTAAEPVIVITLSHAGPFGSDIVRALPGVAQPGQELVQVDVTDYQIGQQPLSKTMPSVSKTTRAIMAACTGRLRTHALDTTWMPRVKAAVISTELLAVPGVLEIVAMQFPQANIFTIRDAPHDGFAVAFVPQPTISAPRCCNKPMSLTDTHYMCLACTGTAHLCRCSDCGSVMRAAGSGYHCETASCGADFYA
jgi:hypothetical protein